MFSHAMRYAVCLNGHITTRKPKVGLFKNAISNIRCGNIDILPNQRTILSCRTNDYGTLLSNSTTTNGVHRNTDKFLQQHFTRKILKDIQNGFRTSSPQCIHPVLLALIKPLSRLVPMILGRRIRKWWKTLSDSEKIKFKETRMKYGYILGGKVFAPCKLSRYQKPQKYA